MDLRRAAPHLVLIAVFSAFVGGSFILAFRESDPVSAVWAWPLGFIMAAVALLLSRLGGSTAVVGVLRGPAIIAICLVPWACLRWLTPGTADETVYFVTVVYTELFFQLLIALGEETRAALRAGRENEVVGARSHSPEQGRASPADAGGTRDLAVGHQSGAGVRGPAHGPAPPAALTPGRFVSITVNAALFMAFCLWIVLDSPRRSEGMAWGVALACFVGGAVNLVLAPPWWRQPSDRRAKNQLFFGFFGLMGLGVLALRLTPSTSDESAYVLLLFPWYWFFAMVFFGAGERRSPAAGRVA